MRTLKVYDVAHLAWRMRLASELEANITEYKTVRERGRDGLDCSSPEQSHIIAWFVVSFAAGQGGCQACGKPLTRTR